MKLSTTKQYREPNYSGSLIYLGSGYYDYYLITKYSTRGLDMYYNKPLLVIGKYSYNGFNLPLDMSIYTMGCTRLAVEKAKKLLILL
jgi:hypothetical protein